MILISKNLCARDVASSLQNLEPQEVTRKIFRIKNLVAALVLVAIVVACEKCAPCESRVKVRCHREKDFVVEDARFKAGQEGPGAKAPDEVECLTPRWKRRSSTVLSAAVVEFNSSTRPWFSLNS